ncbi:efflux RND transporter periplasmic adaptor subunit [Rapidithrix thailandica]|uniref:Efflux RND transporter periplasmic adaptor subunit n=1 Tax=Rapidithrix thailandica TaxID=413964 RepID=A0AAW9RNF9_9BACT
MKTGAHLLYLTFLWGAFACGGKQEMERNEPIKPVKFATVQLQGGKQAKTFNGTSRSASETNLSFRTNGLLLQRNVKVGDRVRKGQLLAQLDPKDLLLNYEKAKASLQSAKIQLETAKSNLERIKQLYQANSASLNDYEQAKNAYANAQSGYQTARKSLDLQQSQLDYAEIIAPTDGVVSATHADINEIVQAGSPVIVINSGEGDIEVNVGIPEVYITKIKQSEEVAIKFSSIPDKAYQGIITEVGFSSAGAATYPVIVKILDAGEEIRPGMPAEVTFWFGEADESPSLAVPVKAVGEDFEGNFVYKLEKDTAQVYLARKVKIELGPLSNHGFEVLDGVKEGDMVATAGLRSLYDGRKVTLLANE